MMSRPHITEVGTNRSHLYGDCFPKAPSSMMDEYVDHKFLAMIAYMVISYIEEVCLREFVCLMLHNITQHILFVQWILGI
jgi:hypothetical protein